MEKFNFKRLTAMLLAVVMCFSLLPVSVFAEGVDEDEHDHVHVDVVTEAEPETETKDEVDPEPEAAAAPEEEPEEEPAPEAQSPLEVASEALTEVASAMGAPAATLAADDTTCQHEKTHEELWGAVTVCNNCGGWKANILTWLFGSGWHGSEEAKPDPNPGHTHDYTEVAATCTTPNACECGATDPTWTAGHSWGEWTTTAEATCGKAGSKERTCSACNTTETEVIPATEDHDWSTEWTSDETNHWHECKTCGAKKDDVGHTRYDGYSYDDDEHYYQCTVCGIIDSTREEHDCTFRTEVVRYPTCISAGLIAHYCECGFASGEEPDLAPNNHVVKADADWNDRTADGHAVVCVCGETIVARAAHTYKDGACTECGYGCQHDWKDATCTEPKTCQTCGLTEGEAKGHGELSTEWTKEDGKHVQMYACGLHYDEETAHAADWNTDEWESNEKNHWHVCKTCGMAGDLKNHRKSEWISDENAHRQECIDCGEIIKSVSHTWNDKNGNKTGKCGVCGYQCLHTDKTPCTELNAAYHTWTCNTCKLSVNELHKKTSKNAIMVEQVTCQKDGYTAFFCESCGEIKSTKTVVKASSQWHFCSEKDYVPNNDATCTTNGTQSGPCKYCGVTLTENIPNSKDPDAHKWGAWEITVKPTATDGGKATHICEYNKNHMETVDIPALGDTTSNIWTKSHTDATCTKDGADVYTSEYGTVIVTIKATGHDFTGKLVSFGKEGHAVYCANGCGTHSEAAAHELHEDEELKEQLAPTCTNPGYLVKVCECGYNELESLDALGHNYVDGVCTRCDSQEPVEHEHNYKPVEDGEIVKATCTQKGKQLYACECGMTTVVELEVDPDNHNYMITARVAATCENDGYEIYTCIGCLDSNKKTTDKAIDHDWGDWTITVNPTVDAEGTAEHTCTREGCGKTESTTIPALDNSGTEEPVWTKDEEKSYPATCLENGVNVYTSEYGTVTEVITAPGSHDFGAWTVVTPAGLYVAGLERRDCQREGCDAFETRGIAMLTPEDFPDFGGGDDTGSEAEVEIDEQEVPLAAGPVTRAQFVDYLWRHEGSPEAELSTFVDVPVDHVYAVAIGWGQAIEIAFGTGEDEFSPDDLVTVEQVRLFLVRFAAWKDMDMPELTTLVGEDDDFVFNCDEVLAEFFGEVPETLEA